MMLKSEITNYFDIASSNRSKQLLDDQSLQSIQL